MLLPSIFGERLLDDWMDFPSLREFEDIDKKLYGKNAARIMKTDVHEHEDCFEAAVDLPGFKKDEVTITLENGYLIIEAAKGLDKDTKDKKGKMIRQERYAGSMQRSFYVGENLTEEDIKAKMEDGVLKLTIPKKEKTPIPEKKTVLIEG
ncbi:MAG: Hsp20/alpha crystallin family protein [Parasporobacterium sp.]|nr:Hsp20/alpha crystallin family protein [Parasporobacterium sp.]